MNLLLSKMLSRLYRAPEDGEGTSDGASSAPASGSSADEGSGVDWGDLNEGISPGSDDSDEDSDPSLEAPAPVTKPAVATPNTPTSDEVPNPDDPADPNATPEVPAEPEVTPPEETGKELTPEELAAQQEKLQKDYIAWEASEVERLASTEYKIDDETATRLQTEPELVLPQLAARLELQATRRALEAVMRMLPQIVPNIAQSSNANKEAETAFYAAHPDLKPHKQQVLQMGQMFRKLNPKATPEEAIEKIGAMVRTAMGLKKVDGAPAGKPATPAKAAPHKPAAAGGRGSSGNPAPAKKSDNVWDDLASDD